MTHIDKNEVSKEYLAIHTYRYMSKMPGDFL